MSSVWELGRYKNPSLLISPSEIIATETIQRLLERLNEAISALHLASGYEQAQAFPLGARSADKNIAMKILGR